MLASLCIQHLDEIFHSWDPIERKIARAICEEVISPSEPSCRSSEVSTVKFQVNNWAPGDPRGLRAFDRQLLDEHKIVTLRAIIQDTCDDYFFALAATGFYRGIIHGAILSWGLSMISRDLSNDEQTSAHIVAIISQDNPKYMRRISRQGYLCRAFAAKNECSNSKL